MLHGVGGHELLHPVVLRELRAGAPAEQSQGHQGAAAGSVRAGGGGGTYDMPYENMMCAALLD